MISHCKWTIDCDSKIDDTILKVDRAAKKIDGIDIDLVQLLLTAQRIRYKLKKYPESVVLCDFLPLYCWFKPF